MVFSPSRGRLDLMKCLSDSTPLKCLATSVERISLVMNFLISFDSYEQYPCRKLTWLCFLSKLQSRLRCIFSKTDSFDASAAKLLFLFTSKALLVPGWCRSCASAAMKA